MQSIQAKKLKGIPPNISYEAGGLIKPTVNGRIRQGIEKWSSQRFKYYDQSTQYQEACAAYIPARLFMVPSIT